MINRHNNTQINRRLNLAHYFNNPTTQKQKQYEVVRALVLEKQSVEIVAKRFGYKISTIYSLIRDVKAGKIELFPVVRKGPQQKRTPSDIQNKIIVYRRQGLSTTDIHFHLAEAGTNISARTVERILKDAGFGKLKRRTNKELGKTLKNKIIPERAEDLDFSELEPFNVDTPVAGVFFFIPYILETGILDIVKECKLPESSIIGSIQACLSMLFFKLIGGKRLSHMGSYDQEPGLGIFAGLNILPKPAYMSTYSCRCSEIQLMDLQNKVVSIFKKKYSDFYNGDFINLDFHSIPHYGEESEMEQVWCGARGKAMKGANTIFATDSQSNAVVYTRADILRSEEAYEVKKFVDYWQRIKGNVNETLVFDCKFTTYNVLDDLEKDNIKFITLRKRYACLIKETLELSKEEWKKVYVPIPKRKHKNVSVYENEVKLKNCENAFRQITVKDHGRSKPTFILTNDKELPLKDILEVYAKRWRVENKLAEMVTFFNLNALSSPIMIRIHFDILWTMITDTLYHRLAQDLRRFENNTAPTIFKKFIDMPGRVVYDGNKFLVKIRKRAHTPILKEVEKLQTRFIVPWLDGKSVEIVWTA
ncbi:MAG: putative orf [Candidatus Scalindua rubra]|uniref:Putative orf n=1 Tax=Candidatus Scalindua rubra TaxID=1872076 RepID=A0A1E3X4K5_9BACT|nr:MAG: putative orf [Candidatus Scalindua rubra]